MWRRPTLCSTTRLMRNRKVPRNRRYRAPQIWYPWLTQGLPCVVHGLEWTMQFNLYASWWRRRATSFLTELSWPFPAGGSRGSGHGGGQQLHSAGQAHPLHGAQAAGATGRASSDLPDASRAVHPAWEDGIPPGCEVHNFCMCDGARACAVAGAALTGHLHMQAKEWADQDAGKVHKSRLEREKEAAAAARLALAQPPPDQACACTHTQMLLGRSIRGVGYEKPLCAELVMCWRVGGIGQSSTWM